MLVHGEHLPLPLVDPQYPIPSSPEDATQSEEQNEAQSDCKRITMFPVQAMDDDTFQNGSVTQFLQNASG